MPAKPILLQCPPTVTGETLCNPHHQPFTGFISHLIQLSFDEVAHIESVSRASFCYPGHTGRVCSQCADGYFASGRWCLECGSSNLHGLIVIANLALLTILIIVIYSKLPTATLSIRQLRHYIRTRFDQHQQKDNQNDIQDKETNQAPTTTPLKLLIFHCQQLSLLLSTSTSQPVALTGFLGVVSSGSTGFSLSSLIALECLSSDADLAARCWLGVVGAIGIGCVAGGVYIIQRMTRSPEATTMRDTQMEEVTPDNTHATTTNVQRENTLLDLPRIYGVCMSLLYLFVFPCAQIALSALACTDHREIGNLINDDDDDSYDPSIVIPPSLVYLNLHPWQACDSYWQQSILPPAIIGVFIWCVAFPIVTTILYRRLHHRLTKRAKEAAAVATLATTSTSPSPSVSIVDSSASSVEPVDPSIWPLCSDLFSPYRREYWFYDQILLLRRLSLVFCLSLIPADSLYLPLCLFIIIQLSALVHHLAQPYESYWMNRGEMLSLYLLLLNYITSIILRSSIETGVSSGHSLDIWTIVLFLSNLIFILILIVGLFASMRQRLMRIATNIQRRINHTTRFGDHKHDNNIHDTNNDDGDDDDAYHQQPDPTECRMDTMTDETHAHARDKSPTRYHMDLDRPLLD